MVAKAIFGCQGEPSGWIEGDTIFDELGQPKAFVEGNIVYTYQGVYLGQFDRGYFWDRHGKAVAFIQDADGEPKRPEHQSAKQRPYPAIEPPRPKTLSKPKPTEKTSEWSKVTFREFLGYSNADGP